MKYIYIIVYEDGTIMPFKDGINLINYVRKPFKLDNDDICNIVINFNSTCDMSTIGIGKGVIIQKIKLMD